MDNFQESECSLQFENHKNTICENLTRYFNRKYFLNVTLICDGDPVLAHQIVLSSCSQFFENILIAQSEPHPILVFTEIPKNHMEMLLKFMYNGRIKVPKEQLSSFLQTAKKLHIRGLNYDELNFAQTHSQEEVRVNATQSTSPADIKTVHQNTSVRENTNVDQNLVNREEPRWLTSVSSPVKTQESGKKVLNPFAVKSRSFTDSDSTTYDLSIPGPSKRSPKKNTSKGIFSSSMNDSDVEFIDKSPTVVVIPDTQLSDNISEVRRKVRSKVRKRTMPAKASDLLSEMNFTSDESDIVARSPKRMRKKALIDNSGDESDAIPPRLISSTPLKCDEDRDSNPAKIQNKTESTVNGGCDKTLFHQRTEEPFEGYLRTAHRSMHGFCFLCGRNLRRIEKHIEKCHKFQSKENEFRCGTCPQMFYYKKMLEIHCRSIHKGNSL